MASMLRKCIKKNLIKIPQSFIEENLQYEVIMGSVAYGVKSEDSDTDVYGFTLPPKELIFPHLTGHIPGFGKQPQGFDQYQQHHVMDEKEGKEYDFTIYSIVKYMNLVMENNPNMLDSLFVPTRCVLHCTQVGSLVRDSRKDFLHKGCWPKFKGYSYQQLHKMDIKNPEEGSNRWENVQKYGYDVKFAYHVVRLMLEVEMILAKHDLDLECNSEVLKAIRRGEWTMEEIKEFFSSKEKNLEELYNTSTLPYAPDEEKIKHLLLQCLEAHYGSLDKCVHAMGKPEQALLEIGKILEKYAR